MTRNLIFDFGSVLLYWDPHYLYDPYFGDREMADWFIKNVCNAQWNSQMDAGKPFATCVAELQDQVAGPKGEEIRRKCPQWHEAIEIYNTRWGEMIGEDVPGMEQLIAELREENRFRLFGLSNWPAEKSYVHERHRSWLEGWVVSGFEGITKPSPEIYKILLERYDLKPEECLFIDDNPANIAAGEALGIKGHLFTDCESLREALDQIRNQEKD